MATLCTDASERRNLASAITRVVRWMVDGRIIDGRMVDGRRRLVDRRRRLVALACRDTFVELTDTLRVL